MTVQILFLEYVMDSIYVINQSINICYGLNITHDLLVMDWHFNVILCLVVLLFYRLYTLPINCILYT